MIGALVIWAASAASASASAPYGWGFSPAPYPEISWGGALDLSEWVFGDLDWDGDVDHDDLLPFEECASGSGVAARASYDGGSHAACWFVDFDWDGDVDQHDFAVLQRGGSGNRWRIRVPGDT